VPRREGNRRFRRRDEYRRGADRRCRRKADRCGDGRGSERDRLRSRPTIGDDGAQHRHPSGAGDKRGDDPHDSPRFSTCLAPKQKGRPDLCQKQRSQAAQNRNSLVALSLADQRCPTVGFPASSDTSGRLRAVRPTASGEAIVRLTLLRRFESDDERTDTDLWRHQAHQTPGQPFLERAAVELFPRGIQRHDPAGMVDVPPAIAVAGGDRPE
jgi:hypothetical protein